MNIAKEGYPLVACFGCASLATSLLGWGSFSLIFLSLLFFVVLFFRDPKRNTPPGENSLVSPADGKIVKIESSNDELQKNSIKISIFMSLFDVHINRAPISGRVIKVQHSPGRFFSAYRDKASSENERNLIILEGSKRITLVQVAGFIARRIICHVKEGEFLEKGAKLGMIKFGSRVDIFLPSDVKIVAKEGQRVRGGETILGYIS